MQVTDLIRFCQLLNVGSNENFGPSFPLSIVEFNIPSEILHNCLDLLPTRCLDLDANNLKALMSLAVCFTNEGHTYKAVESLFKWLKSNPKYSEIASNKILEDYKVSMNAIS